MKKKNIIIWMVDDSFSYLQGASCFINLHLKGMKVKQEITSGKTLLQILAKQPKSKLPDVILLDVQMPEIDGIECAAIITKKYASVKIIALSLFDDSYYVAEMLKNGAMAYLLKGQNIFEFEPAIQSVVKGEKWLDSQISNILVESLKKEKPRKSVLNELERKILWYVSEGLTDKEISEKTFRSHRTIEQYRSALVKKLEARNTAMMIKKAAHAGLI